MPIHASFALEARGSRDWPIGPRKNRRDPDGGRHAIRFPIKLPFNYQAGEDAGSGETVNFSSRGVLLRTDGALILRARIELYIKWPVLLDKSIGLRLIVSGIIVRVEQGRAAVAIESHEFRTCVGPPLASCSETPRANSHCEYPRPKLARQWTSASQRPGAPAGVDRGIFANLQRRKNEPHEARWEQVFEEKFADPNYYNFRLPSQSSPKAGP
jgi:hypothetical protein